MGVEPDALSVMARDQMDAIPGYTMACSLDGSYWRFGDTHWLHPVRTTTYNLFQRIRGFDP
jgi:hypothetical protein